MLRLGHVTNKIWLLIASTLFSLPVLAEEGASKYNLPEPAATITKEIYDLHMLTASVATAIMIIVTGIIIYTLIKFRKSAGYEADLEFNNSWFGRWSWVLVPAIVLGIDFSVAGPAAKVLAKVESYDEADVTVKVIGSQWKWTYEYLEDGKNEGVKIVSNRVGPVAEIGEPVTQGDLHLRDVDNRLVLPTGKRIRFLHTASDVLHAWWVPAIAYKKDSIPGYINETWTVIEKEGTYRGQCAENCGTGHAYMPIVVDVVSPQKFDEWMDGQKVAMAAAAAEATSDKTWTLAELMERGEKVYAANCTACHQATGTGIPNVFPALKGSQMATADLPAHLDMVIHGSKVNPVMAAWGKQLNDLELAAVITYERNAWGNDTGDVVQPADVKAAR